jgi:hypothetical protein
MICFRAPVSLLRLICIGTETTAAITAVTLCCGYVSLIPIPIRRIVVKRIAIKLVSIILTVRREIVSGVAIRTSIDI